MPKVASRRIILVERQRTKEPEISPMHGEASMEDISGVTDTGFGSCSNSLPIPLSGDSIDLLRSKLSSLAESVRSGQSIAVVTNYAAVATKERSATKIAVAEMPPQEHEAWSVYIEGKYPLPEIDWSVNR